MPTFVDPAKPFFVEIEHGELTRLRTEHSRMNKALQEIEKYNDWPNRVLKLAREATVGVCRELQPIIGVDRAKGTNRIGCKADEGDDSDYDFGLELPS